MAIVKEATNQFVPIVNKYQQWTHFIEGYQKYISKYIRTKRTTERKCMYNSNTEIKSALKGIEDLEKDFESVKNKFIDSASFNVENVPLFTNLNTDVILDFDTLEQNIRNKKVEQCMFKPIELRLINKMLEDNKGEQEVAWIIEIEEGIQKLANIVKQAMDNTSNEVNTESSKQSPLPTQIASSKSKWNSDQEEKKTITNLNTKITDDQTSKQENSNASTRFKKKN